MLSEFEILSAQQEEEAALPEATRKLLALCNDPEVDILGAKAQAKIKALIKQGASVSAPAKWHRQPLTRICAAAPCYAHAQKAIEVLLQAGARVSVNLVVRLMTDDKTDFAVWAIGKWPDCRLTDALWRDVANWANPPEAIVGALVARGMDINYRTEEGACILHLLACSNRVPSVQSLCALLELGADPTATNHQDKTPLQWASGKHLENFERAFATHQAKLQAESLAHATPPILPATPRRAL